MHTILSCRSAAADDHKLPGYAAQRRTPSGVALLYCCVCCITVYLSCDQRIS
jgi:hypothetical protein